AAGGHQPRRASDAVGGDRLPERAVRDRLPGDDGRFPDGDGTDPDPVHPHAAPGDGGAGAHGAEGVSATADRGARESWSARRTGPAPWGPGSYLSRSP